LRVAEGERMVLRNGTASVAAGDDRDISEFDELLEFIFGMRPEDILTTAIAGLAAPSKVLTAISTAAGSPYDSGGSL